MRSLTLSVTVLACLAATPVLAQTAGTYTETGARPGNEIGTGMSLPMGTRASNIDQNDTRSLIAPNLPAPPVGAEADPASYLRAAQTALRAGRTGETQQALEMAQTRLLDRAVPMGQTNNPSDNPAVVQISQALKALASGDRTQAMQLIEAALPAATAAVR
jgi:hypothetical protein